MDSKKMPLKGLIILKRLNTRENEIGVDLKDTEYVFASGKYTDIIKKLCKFPKKKLSWLIVAIINKDAEGKLVYSNGITGLQFLQKAQAHLARQPTLN